MAFFVCYVPSYPLLLPSPCKAVSPVFALLTLTHASHLSPSITSLRKSSQLSKSDSQHSMFYIPVIA